MHISVTTVHHLLATYGYLAVFLFVMIESSGIPFPGETMLITAAAYAGTGRLLIPFVIASAAAGAILGDNVGYIVGRTGGRVIVDRYGKYVHLDARKIQIAERFFDKHGDKTVFIGRFIAVLRAWAAFLAGVNRMHWLKFFAFNAAGGITWSILYGTLAFEFGKSLQDKLFTWIGRGGLILAAIAAVVVFVLHKRGVKFMNLEEQTVDQSEAKSQHVATDRT